MSAKEKSVAILGAGLVGSLLATYLLKYGYKVTIYERRPDMRKDVISAGRSINLALSDRGWRGLAGVGLSETVKKVAIPMHGRMIHNADSSINFQPYGKEGQAIYSVSRGGLNCLLMDEAEKRGAVIHYNERCTNVDLNTNTAQFENQLSGKKSDVNADLVVGSDGAFSAARLSLMFTERYNYSQQYLEHGYKELTIPANADGTHRIEKNALHIWPRGSFMLIALPNLDGSFTCTLFLPFEGKQSFQSLDTNERVTSFFKETFPDAVTLMPTLEEDFFNNPTGSLVTVKCFPWTWGGKGMLIGDAAHAVVPFYGQGMNCGFEDCADLDMLINKYDHHWNQILPEYEQLRKPSGDAIADLAVANFFEMRDLVAHPDFLLRKKIEARFSNKYPGKWIPLYTMVTFSDHIPYHVAKTEGKRQEAIMDQVMRTPGIESKWDSEEVEKLILDRLG
ncbi:MAG TPA: NAD(P)/FAD-dependent oxidoreductase [Bacteroidia bacterium]|nr:NAD(P)/FAD-dependent oxidoreductase [Bacteroidia bacterium]